MHTRIFLDKYRKLFFRDFCSGIYESILGIPVLSEYKTFLKNSKQFFIQNFLIRNSTFFIIWPNISALKEYKNLLKKYARIKKIKK